MIARSLATIHAQAGFLDDFRNADPDRRHPLNRSEGRLKP